MLDLWKFVNQFLLWQLDNQGETYTFELAEDFQHTSKYIEEVTNKIILQHWAST